MTLWAASAAEPGQLVQGKSGSDGRFELSSQETLLPDAILYVVTRGGEATANKGAGDNPAAALLSVVGNTPPSKIVVNEMTTVASVWTLTQFLDGEKIKGPALSLKIAAGNVPNFVDLETGGWGGPRYLRRRLQQLAPPQARSGRNSDGDAVEHVPDVCL